MLSWFGTTGSTVGKDKSVCSGYQREIPVWHGVGEGKSELYDVGEEKLVAVIVGGIGGRGWGRN